MTREIKFRAWNKDSKHFVHRNNYHHMTLNLDGTPYDLQTGSGNFELMQFTGLKDSKGKEIWEGDIVKHSHHSRPQTVFYSEIDARYKIGWQGHRTQFDKQSDAFYSEIMEVIGNIYENKELLKGK